MKKYTDTIVNSTTALPVSGARVYVRDGSNNLATLYADDGSTPLVTEYAETNALGRFEFYVADGNYKLEYYFNDAVQVTVPDIEIISAENLPRAVATRDIMAALDGSIVKAVILVEASHEGTWIWSNANLSAEVTADPTRLTYVAPASDPTGATGAWVKNSDTLDADLAASTGAALIGSTGGITVQAALNLKTTIASLAASSGSSLVGFLQSGTGPVIRTLQDKGRDIVDLRDWPVNTAGTNDYASELRSAIAQAAGRTLHIPPFTFVAGSSLGTIPANTRLQGANKATSKILRAFNGGTMLTLGDSVSLDNIWFDGNSATYTGGGIFMDGSNGNQNVTNVRSINHTSGIPIHFSTDTCGSRSNWSNVEAYRVDGTAGSGLYAIVMYDAGSPAGGCPRRFDHIETSGYSSFDFGGGNDVYVTASTLFELKYSDNSRGIHISTSRISSPSDPITLKGTGDIVGCGISPAITIGAGAAFNLGPNFYNSGWTDSSANSQTLVFDQAVNSYTPTFYGGGVAFTLGNGSVSGNWIRVGNMIQFQAKCIVGTTTTVPAGAITCSLPEAVNASISAQSDFNGNLNTGGVTYSLSARAASSATTIGLIGANALMTNASPAAFGGGTAAVIEIGGSFIR